MLQAQTFRNCDEYSKYTQRVKKAYCEGEITYLHIALLQQPDRILQYL